MLLRYGEACCPLKGGNLTGRLVRLLNICKEPKVRYEGPLTLEPPPLPGRIVPYDQPETGTARSFSVTPQACLLLSSNKTDGDPRNHINSSVGCEWHRLSPPNDSDCGDSLQLSQSTRFGGRLLTVCSHDANTS